MLKRLYKLVLLVAMIAVLASCGVNSDTNTENEPAQTGDQVASGAQEQPVLQEMSEAQNPTDATGSEEAQAGETEARAVGEYIRISPREAEEMMLTEDVVILDVRTQDEFSSGHIPGAVLLPSFEVRENAFSVIPDPEQIILVYCRAGSRSANAAMELIDMGFTRVYDFGGINSWHGEITHGG